MELIADGVLILAATVAGLYCMVLSRRLHSLTQMESGLGKAITGMSAQVDEMKDALAKAKSSTEERATALSAQLVAAEEVAQRLERLLKASEELEESARQKAPAEAPQSKLSSFKAASMRRKPRAAPAEEDEATGRKRIDGLISSYLNEFEGEDEADIARRLVSALTVKGPIGKERAI